MEITSKKRYKFDKFNCGEREREREKEKDLRDRLIKNIYKKYRKKDPKCRAIHTFNLLFVGCFSLVCVFLLFTSFVYGV